jgi:hypothetical protein
MWVAGTKEVMFVAHTQMDRQLLPRTNKAARMAAFLLCFCDN